MRLIDAKQVHELLEYKGLVEAIRQAHLGEMPKMSDRIIYQEPNEQGPPDSFIILPAWQPQEGLLCKLVTSFPGNLQKHGVSNVNSIYAFVNGQTGVTEAVIEGEAMIFRKTSADSALGADILARKDAKTLLMIGAGGPPPTWCARIAACAPASTPSWCGTAARTMPPNWSICWHGKRSGLNGSTISMRRWRAPTSSRARPWPPNR
jgi:ornithine cyclodeaminase